MKKLKLNVELVPMTVWGHNLRKLLPANQWDRIRNDVFKKAGYKCEICGDSQAELHCHEQWEYDDLEKSQKLEGLVALCNLCHHIKHIGRAGILIRKGHLDGNRLEKHFIDVNEVSKRNFQEHVEESFAKWQERSKYQWTTDFGEFSNLVK